MLRLTDLNIHLFPKLSDRCVNNGGAGFRRAAHLATFYRDGLQG